MRHARVDYDAIQPFPTRRPHHVKVNGALVMEDDLLLGVPMEPIIPDDEPVLLIRGQDLAAIPTALAWCKAADDLGADPALIETVKRHIVLIHEWQREHGVKVPDAPAGVLR